MKTGLENYIKSKHDDKDYILAALEFAEVAKAKGNIPIAATLLIGTKRFTECNTMYTEGSKLNHAEINAIQKAVEFGFRKFDNAILYSTIEPSTVSALVALEFGIKEFVFGAYQKNGFITSKQLNLDVLPITYRGGILAEECKNILPSRSRDLIHESI